MGFERFFRAAAVVALVAGLAACGGGSGDAGGDSPSATAPVYPQSVVLGRLSPEPVSLIEPQGATGSVSIVVPAASTLLSAGPNPLVSSYRTDRAPGVIVACVSAPADSTGVIEGINLGVHVKSVAGLLDSSWSPAGDQQAAWNELAAAHAVFEGWENCGEKPEGRPSPASLRTLDGDGGFREDVYDGNPSTNLNIIALHYTAAQASAMLSPDGYLNALQPGTPTRMRLRVYRNAANQAVLVEQGLPETGSTAATPGYLAVYFRR